MSRDKSKATSRNDNGAVVATTATPMSSQARWNNEDPHRRIKQVQSAAHSIGGSANTAAIARYVLQPFRSVSIWRSRPVHSPENVSLMMFSCPPILVSSASAASLSCNNAENSALAKGSNSANSSRRLPAANIRTSERDSLALCAKIRNPSGSHMNIVPQ